MNIQWDSQETLLCDLVWPNSGKTNSYSINFIRLKNKKHKMYSSFIVIEGGLDFKMWRAVNANAVKC